MKTVRCGIAPILLASLFILSASACFASRTVFVKSDSKSDGPGNDWAHAYRTISGALAAAASGDGVVVAAGIYSECIKLKSGVALWGGFPAAGGSWKLRDPKTNQTTLDGKRSGSVVTVPAGATSATVIDGFTIRNGTGTRPDPENELHGGGIYIRSSSPTVSHNVISGNVADNGGGIGTYGDCAFLISENTITGNTATRLGSGIYCGGWPEVTGSAARILNNRITSNTGPFSAIFTNGGCSPTIAGNVIAVNKCSGILMTGEGTAPVTNNTIAYNGGDGIVPNWNSRLVAVNNIIAFNDGIGVVEGHDETSQPSLRNNCVYGNVGGNYSKVSPGSDDISTDPLFANGTSGDYHLKATSPCVSAGWAGAIGVPSTDIDGESRTQRGTIDIGADEYWPKGTK